MRFNKLHAAVTAAAMLVSELREKLMQEADTLTDEAMTERRNAVAKAEQEHRTALDALNKAMINPDDDGDGEGDDDGDGESGDGEGKAIRALSKRVEIRHYMAAAMTGKAVAGAEKELAEHRGLRDDGTVPWDALLPLEERQDAATSVASDFGGVGHPQASILGRVFGDTAAAYLGVRMPSVGAGEPVYPVLTGGVTGAAEAKASEHDAVAATFSSVTVSPHRLTARYLWAVEDVVRLRGMEDALRADLRAAMGQLLDTQIVTGNGVAPNMNGILNRLTDPSAPTADSTAANFISAFYAGVDGLHASGVAGVRMLIGLDTLRRLAVLQVPTSGAYALDELRRQGGSFRASRRIAAPAGANRVQQAIRTAEPGAAIAPIWQGLSLIRDPYTNAAKGQVALTAIMLAGFTMTRTDAWAQVAFRLGAA